MIHHVSIPAGEPRRVASVLAELISGRVFPYPGRIAGAFMTVSDDEHGSMIEVFPHHIVLQPGEHGTPMRPTKHGSLGYTPFHLLLSVRIDSSAVERIGVHEGWRTGMFGRGSGQAPSIP
jgi:hypothetical protein